MSEHGNIGNKNAAKSETAKISGDKIFIPAPPGTKARITKWANSRGHTKYGTALREAILKMLDSEGF